MSEDDFPFSKVGYVSFLEATSPRDSYGLETTSNQVVHLHHLVLQMYQLERRRICTCAHFTSILMIWLHILYVYMYTCIQYTYCILYNKHPRHVYVFKKSLAFYSSSSPKIHPTLFVHHVPGIQCLSPGYRRTLQALMKEKWPLLLVGKWRIFVGPPICFCEAIPLIAGWR